MWCGDVVLASVGGFGGVVRVGLCIWLDRVVRRRRELLPNGELATGGT